MTALIVFFALAMTAGCSKGEKEEKINPEESRVTARVSRTVEDRNIIYFGFDLRLSPRDDARMYAPLMRYLSEKTGHPFKIRFTTAYEDTQRNLGKGITQFAALGAVSYLKAQEKFGAKILVRGLNRENKAAYHSIIFTQTASTIKNVRDIKGRTFAFGSRESTQGHLIPRKMLEDAGVSLNDLKKYEFTGSHKDAVDEVLAGRFDAGGAQDTLVTTLAREGKIKIIKVSGYYPSSGIAANKDVDPTLIAAVKKALLELDPQGAHKGILKDWDKTEMPNGFAEAFDKDYAGLKELLRRYGM